MPRAFKIHFNGGVHTGCGRRTTDISLRMSTDWDKVTCVQCLMTRPHPTEWHFHYTWRDDDD